MELLKTRRALTDVAFFPLLLALVAALGGGVSQQPVMADVAAAIDASAVAAVGDAPLSRFNIAYFSNLPVYNGGIYIRQQVRHGGIADVGDRTGHVDVALLVGTDQLAAHLLEQLFIAVVQCAPKAP